MQLVVIAGKRASGGEREKTCNSWQARENEELVASVEKRVTGGKRGKRRVNQVLWFCFRLLGYRNQQTNNNKLVLL